MAKATMKAKLTRAQKRVAVAKDVLLQLKLETYVPSPGDYVVIRDQAMHAALRESASSGIGAANQQVLLKLEPKSCGVCGIGAVFLSKVRKFNGVKGDITRTPDELMVRACRTLFSQGEMRVIERIFEGWIEWESARWGTQAGGRLAAAMKSIVAKRGEFDVRDVRRRIERMQVPAERGEG